ncbi:hypothetical protein DL96DRAFT_1613071 [Flagelloscypha sp. PMI_526]|nr:hypothetical protein DL96DRAFT_1613071 [Flagelloscypha sp. PMI_526]
MDETGDQAFLNWNMLFGPNMVRRSDDPMSVSWSNGRREPATIPRVNNLTLMFLPNVGYPWKFEVVASDPACGVLCEDVIMGISADLYKLAEQDDYQLSSTAKQSELRAAYQRNRERNAHVPGGVLGQGMRRLDWLGQTHWFAGISAGAAAKRAWGMDLPGSLVINATRMRGMSEQEAREAEYHTRRSERARSRSRRREPTPQPPPESDSEDSSEDDSDDDASPV